MSYPLSVTLHATDDWSDLTACLNWLLPRHTPAELMGLVDGGRVSFVQAHERSVVTALNAALPRTGEVIVELPNHSEAPSPSGGSMRPPWTLVWENHDLMVVNKAPGLPVSRTTRNLFDTLISAVRRHSPWRDARLLHRLDAETQGLLVIAKYEAADRRWKKKLDRLMLHKRYRAWVIGRPEWQQQEVQWPLSERSDSAIRTQMYAVNDATDPAFTKIKECHTRVTLLETVVHGGQDYSLVECELLTGRKHQIRAHLAALGHPIVGDKIYAHEGRYYLKRLQGPLSQEDERALMAPTHCLQSYELVLNVKDGPVTIRVPQPFSADFPEEFDGSV